MDIFWEFINGLFRPETHEPYYLVKTTCDLRVNYRLYSDIYGVWDYFKNLSDKAISINYDGDSYHVDEQSLYNLGYKLRDYTEANDTTPFKITIAYADHPVNNNIFEIIPLLCN